MESDADTVTELEKECDPVLVVVCETDEVLERVVLSVMLYDAVAD